MYYQSGVGVGDDFQGNADFGDNYEKLRGTATGRCITCSSSSCGRLIFSTEIGSKIRDAYNFIAQNYTKGDRI